TGNYNASILAELVIWNKQKKPGVVFDSSTGFTLPDKAVRSPDAAWIDKKRWAGVPEEDKRRFSHICPDFVIELKSESDSLKELKLKMAEWISNGCRLGWLIAIDEQKTYIYQPKTAVKISPFNKILSAGKVLPGF